ncbi:hypothetical protein EQV77_06815 [Halobacillus fulvus]|nr:hypothetical protein EQV77_06815 [Halobacillus fulvus]
MNATFETLKHDHRIHIGSSHTPDYQVSDLLRDRSLARELIDIQTDQLRAPNTALSGLLFGKMYSVFAMGMFETMIKHNLIIDTSPHLIGIELLEKNVMNYHVNEEAVHEIDDLSDEEVRALLYTFVSSHIHPLFRMIANVSKSRSIHMHSLVSHNLHQKAKALVEEGYDEESVRFYLDLLTGHDLFPERRRNPLHFEFRLYTSEEGTSTYVRRHCCMKYMLHEGAHAKRCPTCPLISDQERDEKL